MPESFHGTPLRALTRPVLFLIWACCASSVVSAAEDPFQANVRPTDPLSPEAQRETLRVPDGFEVQLVACEPDINKPMNLAFDALGRLWVTTSLEYPRPAPPDRPARDRLMIFEDFGPDGRARRVTTFAEGLNIPIGVYPFRSSSSAGGGETWKAVVWSIPNLWLLEDTDGDGRADRREVLYGPFDHTRDTHGNQASFRRGFDGWLYATHGFNNDSHVAGRDGHRVDLNSGNTYRVRLDGSRIEQFTWGQVNPFGLAWDPQGNLYSSDCHSEPIYLLLPGGYYPSFGKPHDGLGFAPNMMERIRGSTAIDGISYYADDLWPEEYRDAVLIGDVMTSRVYRDHAERRGSGRIARARPDFLISSDPWFRPVDTTFGPEGAFYVADFYNRIIGHYEVPLDHPGRDRERGRIWRVVRRGVPLRPQALAQDFNGLIDELGSSSLTRRMLAMNEIADRFGKAALDSLQSAALESTNRFQRVHALWLLQRISGPSADRLGRAMDDGDPLVRIHVMRMTADLLGRFTRGEAVADEEVRRARALGRRGLADPDPEVQRCAAEALAWAPNGEDALALVSFRQGVPTEDVHLVYSVRRALRNQLADDAVFRQVDEVVGSDGAGTRTLLDIAVAVNTESAADFLVRHLGLLRRDPGQLGTALSHAARWAGPLALEGLVRTARGELGDGTMDLDLRLALFRSVQQGLARRGLPPPRSVREWGQELARGLIQAAEGGSGWYWQPLPASNASSADPWAGQERECGDGRRARLISSHPRGETRTGVLRSRPFEAPSELAFFLAGHDGHPGQPSSGRNRVLLRDATTGQTLVETSPPRNDTARLVRWNLGWLSGRSVRIDVVDGHDGDAYAWIALGRIEGEGVPPLRLAPSEASAYQVAAAEIAGWLGLEGLRESLTRVMRDPWGDPVARGAAVRVLMEHPVMKAVAELCEDGSQPLEWRRRLADVMFAEDRSGGEDFVASVWREAPRRFQLRVAAIAGASRDLTADLVDRMTDGRAPATLLQDRRLLERLSSGAEDLTRQALKRLVQQLPSADPEEQRLIEDRMDGFRKSPHDAARGAEVFRAACAACHQVNGEGGVVGPQLSGIGTRGLERLCEDILAPNRNVDHAFRTTVLTLKDGETVSGLFRRREGATLVLANAAGAEFVVGQDEIVERKESDFSIMPTNFGEALSPEDTYHLLAYLLGTSGG